MIPDDEPWWMVRCSLPENSSSHSMPGDSTLADKVCQGPVPNGIDLERELNALPFRPIGYEW